MKKLITNLLLSITLFTVSVPKADAVVGLVLGSPVVMALGAISAVGGYGGASLLDEVSPAYPSWHIFDIITVPLGLLLLEEGQEAEINFSEIRECDLFSQQELEIYNNELDQLNAINQTIISELQTNSKVNAEQLWSEYGEMLSPATIRIAAYSSNQLLKSLR